MDDATPSALTRVHFAELRDADTVNRRLALAYAEQRQAAHVRQTHHFHGRFENTYIDAEYIPELKPVSDLALRMARALLGTTELRLGFWFNEMQPGQLTSLHSHAELDECLSAVYYVTCPDDSGRLILHDDEAQILIEPRPGLLVLFPPNVPHEVRENKSSGTRLSVAFNFGPPNSET